MIDQRLIFFFLRIILGIRTYAVVPLNEECGLIEWVPNTAGLRPILTNLYASAGIAPTVLLLLPLKKSFNIFFSFFKKMVVLVRTYEFIFSNYDLLYLKSKELRDLWGRKSIPPLQIYRFASPFPRLVSCKPEV